MKSIWATLKSYIHALKLSFYYYTDIYLKNAILALLWGARKLNAYKNISYTVQFWPYCFTGWVVCALHKCHFSNADTVRIYMGLWSQCCWYSKGISCIYWPVWLVIHRLLVFLTGMSCVGCISVDLHAGWPSSEHLSKTSLCTNPSITIRDGYISASLGFPITWCIFSLKGENNWRVILTAV